MRGIANPIAFKVGPSITKEDLINLFDILNPNNESKRITGLFLEWRFKVEELLPPLVGSS